jgi:hypothetical protein
MTFSVAQPSVRGRHVPRFDHARLLVLLLVLAGCTVDDRRPGSVSSLADEAGATTPPFEANVPLVTDADGGGGEAKVPDALLAGPEPAM